MCSLMQVEKRMRRIRMEVVVEGSARARFDMRPLVSPVRSL
jgi:hypothetical protein